MQLSIHTYLIYTTKILTKGLSAITNYCQMQEELHVQQYKNKEKIKCYEKKDIFLKVFWKQ